VASKVEIMMWAERILSLKGGPPHLLLDLSEKATLDDAQAAFHKVARAAHPDLHRNTLSKEELELVTSAYAAVAGAYMEHRSKAVMTQRIRPIKPDEAITLTEAPPTAPAPAAARSPAPAPSRPTPTPAAPAAPSASKGNLAESLASAEAIQQMSPKALVYFRKAESALKRGDLKSALLQIKLAAATDPQSTFLRNAIAEVDAELRRTT
jgi:hypothetical protein